MDTIKLIRLDGHIVRPEMLDTSPTDFDAAFGLEDTKCFVALG